MRRGLPRARFAAAVTLTALIIGGLAPAAATAATPVAASGSATAAALVQAADLTTFAPGNIISDAVFFNSSTMSAAQIQSFFQAKVPVCQAGYTCLKDKYDTTRTTSADAMCGAYAGGLRERASTIVYKVARACGINPQVLIVTMQKEQGLVTHTWPSEFRFTLAMGQGCPDTAACDTRYYGFFNQVYGAAWQLKRYANPPGTSQYFTWYAPARTWSILYHPNRACGSSPVAVKNQATADLYYYTPYQPNTAALRAGYGQGDGCSSYGNRNFYSYFRDWFGSTQVASTVLFSVGPAIYLISGGTAYHIMPAEWPSYRATFGRPAPVGADYLTHFANGGDASLYLQSAATGTVAYLDGARTHRFASCNLVAMWGGSCSKLVRMSSADFDRIGAGPEMTRFARLAAGGAIYMIDETSLAPIYDAATLVLINGGSTPFTAMMQPARRAAMTKGPVRFPAARVVAIKGSAVYLPSWDGRLLHLPWWALAPELGLPSTAFRSVAGSSMSGYVRSGTLSNFVSCNGMTYFGASGTLRPVSADGAVGFSPSTLGPETCAVLKKSSEPPSAVFVQASNSPNVFAATDGTYHHVTTMALLKQIGAGSLPRVLRISPANLARLTIGDPVIAAGSLVKAPGSDAVYLADGDRLVHLPTWAMAQAYGVDGPMLTVSDAYAARRSAHADLTHFARCGDGLYSPAFGALSQVLSGDPAGNAVTVLADSTCAALTLTGPPIAGKVFLSDHTHLAVATGGGFLWPLDAATAKSMNGNVTPTPLIVPSGYIATLPRSRR
ncbi:hypothetical protein GCM10009776_05050 [Microbacterium deminutum]|uniref:Hemagglutinin-related protein n=1 Tax=Microbacterium deminutum TaxID=344164 RepID=A0ABP5BJ71_9MICO